MAFVLQKKMRGERWYASFKDATGRHVQRATGHRPRRKRSASPMGGGLRGKGGRLRSPLTRRRAPRNFDPRRGRTWPRDGTLTYSKTPNRIPGSPWQAAWDRFQAALRPAKSYAF